MGPVRYISKVVSGLELGRELLNLHESREISKFFSVTQTVNGRTVSAV
jgi:hypothetical protein